MSNHTEKKRDNNCSNSSNIIECTFFLQPRTTICHIFPSTYIECFLIIGQVEMKIPLKLPFTSPRQLRTKLKIIFETEDMLDNPYLELQTLNPWVFEKCYGVTGKNNNHNHSQLQNQGKKNKQKCMVL
jgi:hypothetical protein